MIPEDSIRLQQGLGCFGLFGLFCFQARLAELKGNLDNDVFQCKGSL